MSSKRNRNAESSTSFNTTQQEQSSIQEETPASISYILCTTKSLSFFIQIVQCIKKKSRSMFRDEPCCTTLNKRVVLIMYLSNFAEFFKTAASKFDQRQANAPFSFLVRSANRYKYQEKTVPYRSLLLRFSPKHDHPHFQRPKLFKEISRNIGVAIHLFAVRTGTGKVVLVATASKIK